LSPEEVGHVSSVCDIILHVEACLAVSKIVHCIEKVFRVVGCSDMEILKILKCLNVEFNPFFEIMR